MEDRINEAKMVNDFAALKEILQSHVNDDINPAEFEDSELTAEAALDALHELIKADLPTSSLTFELETEVINCLRAFQSEPSIVEVALSIIRLTAKNSKVYINSLNAAEHIIQSMQCHKDGEATVQEQGCLCIEQFGASGKEAFLSARALAHVEFIINGNLITNERNKAYAERAKAVLN